MSVGTDTRLPITDTQVMKSLMIVCRLLAVGLLFSLQPADESGHITGGQTGD